MAVFVESGLYIWYISIFVYIPKMQYMIFDRHYPVREPFHRDYIIVSIILFFDNQR